MHTLATTRPSASAAVCNRVATQEMPDSTFVQTFVRSKGKTIPLVNAIRAVESLSCNLHPCAHLARLLALEIVVPEAVVPQTLALHGNLALNVTRGVPFIGH